MANKNALLKFDGMDAVIAKMEKIIANTSGGKAGQDLKKVYRTAAKVHSQQVHRNIDALPVSDKLKKSLHLCTVTNDGPENKSNAISQMRQTKAVDINPYWFEYGTQPRSTGKGKARGQIKATPVFNPATAQSKDRVSKSIIDGIKKLVDL